MADLREITRQLKVAGFKNSVWGWSAIKQLPAILEEDEEIERVVTGVYDGGHAMVLATNKRMIFLDKKIMSFRVEDIHYEMVSEVEHFLGVIFARLKIRCLSNTVELSSMSARQVRDFAAYVDGKVNSIRLNMRTWEQMMQANNVMGQNPTQQTGRPIISSAFRNNGYNKIR